MQRWTTLSTITMLALLMAACNQAADTHDADVKALNDNETQWNQDYVSKDPARIAAHYADDAVLMGPGMPVEGEARSLSTVGGSPAGRSRSRAWDEIPISVALPRDEPTH